MSRRKFMPYHHTGSGTWEGWSVHMFCRTANRPALKAPKTQMVNLWLCASPDIFSTNKVHKRLPVSLSEEDHVVPLRCSPFHSRRSCGHAWDGQSDRTRSLFQEASHGRGRDMPLQHIAIDLSRVARREIDRHS